MISSISFGSMAGGLVYSYFTFNTKSSPRDNGVHEVKIHINSSTGKHWQIWTLPHSPLGGIVLFHIGALEYIILLI